MSDTPPSSFLHSPAVVVLVKGAVLIGALAMLFWGVRSCITAPVEKPMEVAEKLIEAGREVGLTLINKGFSSDHGGVALIVQKDEKVANLVTVERTFEYEYRYDTPGGRKFPAPPPGRSRTAGRTARKGPLVLILPVREARGHQELHDAHFPIPFFYLAKTGWLL